MEARSETQPATVFLVDDHAIIRASLRVLLAQRDTLRVIGESGDPLTALQDIAAKRPTLVLLDVTMPGLSGIDMIPRIRAVHPSARIVMVTHLDSHDVRSRALAAGADAFVSKGAPLERLLETIDEVLRTPRPVGGPPPASASVSGPLASLTPREREVLQLLVLGRTNKAVAASLGVSLSTVKKHRESLQRKLGVHSQAELALLAIREGLMEA